MSKKGINKVTLVGNIGADPEVKGEVVNISVATSESWVDKKSGEKVERTEWHRVTFFGALAKIVAEYASKGRLVFVEGSLRTNKYTDKDGVDRYSTDVIASEFQLLGSQSSKSSS